MTMRKPYYPYPSLTWWIDLANYSRLHRAYTFFMLRELSAVFVAGYAVLLLILVIKSSAGRDDLVAFVGFLDSPGMLVVHAFAFLFATLHTVTWFNLTPKALNVRRGEEKIPPLLIVLPNYVAWLVLSGLIALLFLV